MSHRLLSNIYLRCWCLGLTSPFIPTDVNAGIAFFTNAYSVHVVVLDADGATAGPGVAHIVGRLIIAVIARSPVGHGVAIENRRG